MSRAARRPSSLPTAGDFGPRPVPLAWSLTVGALAFAAYAFLCPGVPGDKDSGEFMLVLARNGVAHPTGYPLYTLLGHLFCVIAHALGVGWGRAANLWSAVGGGVAVAALHALAVCLTTGLGDLSRRTRFLLALLPTVFFAFNPLWTMETTLAEVYSWHVAWVCAAALLFLSLAERLTAPGSAASRGLWRDSVLWGLFCGAGLAHHATSVLTALPLSAGLAWLAWRARVLRPTLLGWGLTGVALPLFTYFRIAWRAFHPGAAQWPLLASSWRGIFDHLTGAQYRYLLGHFAPSVVQRGFLAAWIFPYLAAGLIALIWSVWLACPGTERLARVALAVAALLQTVEAFLYGAADPGSYFLPALALGMAALAGLGGAAITSGPRARQITPAALLVAGACVTVAAVLWTGTARDRQRVYERYDGLVRSMWTALPFERGFVLWADDMSSRLRGYQVLRGEKPHVVIVNPRLVTHPVARARFRQDYGFDPAAGIAAADLPARVGAVGDSLGLRVAREVGRIINVGTDLPVVLFDPSVPSVRLLKKPGQGAAAAPDETSDH